MMRTDHESSNTLLNSPSFYVKYLAHAHYRFLLTDRDPASLMHVIPYDPKTADGPLKQKGKAWF
jgi:hypothetical protein